MRRACDLGLVPALVFLMDYLIIASFDHSDVIHGASRNSGSKAQCLCAMVGSVITYQTSKEIIFGVIT